MLFFKFASLLNLYLRLVIIVIIILEYTTARRGVESSFFASPLLIVYTKGKTYAYMTSMCVNAHANNIQQ
jgi:hypothetical protein